MTTKDLEQQVRERIAKWRKQAEEHGVRQFTGNDHALFANELEADLTSAKGNAEGEVEAVRKALDYLDPFLDQHPLAAPDWAIQLASILTGGDGCGYTSNTRPAAQVYQCPRCATSMEVDPTAKPAAQVQHEAATKVSEEDLALCESGAGICEDVSLHRIAAAIRRVVEYIRNIK